MIELAKFRDYLDSKEITEKDLTKEEAFKAGQIAFIAAISDTLGISVSYNGLQ